MKKYHVFISHAWTYTEHYCEVEDWLNEAKSEYLLDWDNYSVPLLDSSPDPNSFTGKQKLKRKLDDQIARASVVIILSGMYITNAEWIEYEIIKANHYRKYIIGIKPWEQEDVPNIVLNYADVMIKWNKYSIIRAMLES